MKKLLIIFLLSWSSVAFANDAEFQRGNNAYYAENYREAFQIFKSLAEQGHAEALFSLGQMYEHGYGVDQDIREATSWYRKATNQGNGMAAWTLGGLYKGGLGVPQSGSEALKWNLRAVKLGIDAAIVDVALAYRFGKGVPKDMVKAYMWYSIIVANGDSHVDLATRTMDEIAKEDLTFSELKRAKDLAVRCFDSDYRDCD